VADRITVMRQARVVTTLESSGASVAELARLMVGELAADTDEPRDARVTGDTALADDTLLSDDTLLAIRGLTLDQDARRILDGVSFAVRRGEIGGIAGVDGNGQTELVEILAGARRATSGRIALRIEAGGADGGLSVIPQNRDLDGLILDMALWENIILARPIRRRLVRCGWLSRARAVESCRDLLARFRIRAAGPEQTAAALSGGNRQRL